jgi:hypothetical protein
MVVAAGETRNVSLAGEVRTVKVIGPSDAPAWWWCVDLETEMQFAARVGWFVEPEDAADHAPPRIQPRPTPVV